MLASLKSAMVFACKSSTFDLWIRLRERELTSVRLCSVCTAVIVYIRRCCCNVFLPSLSLLCWLPLTAAVYNKSEQSSSEIAKKVNNLPFFLCSFFIRVVMVKYYCLIVLLNCYHFTSFFIVCLSPLSFFPIYCFQIALNAYKSQENTSSKKKQARRS